MSSGTRTNELLGYPADARLLIVNNDDFGMCHAINEATIRSITQGLATSCTLMMPCPWRPEAIDLLRRHPDVPFGVHLTAVCEHANYCWTPMASPEKVPSVVGEGGYYWRYERIDEFIEQVSADELELEFRTQIEALLETGLRPTHLDSHCHTHTRRPDLFDRVVGLAIEYGLAVRAHTEPLIEEIRRRGRPANDFDVLDSYRLDLDGKQRRYCQMLRELPAGLTEWATHPALEADEVRGMEPTWEVRKTDLDFLMSDEPKRIIEEEGIIPLDYRPLQKAWREINDS